MKPDPQNISILNGHHQFCHCVSCWRLWDKSAKFSRNHPLLLKVLKLLKCDHLILIYAKDKKNG